MASSYEDVDDVKLYNRNVAFIKAEKLAKRLDGNLVKYSDELQAVSVVSMTPNQYIDYWTSKYKNCPELCEEIYKLVTEKLNSGLLDREKMAKLIDRSKDFSSDKQKALESLGYKYVPREGDINHKK